MLIISYSGLALAADPIYIFYDCDDSDDSVEAAEWQSHGYK